MSNTNQNKLAQKPKFSVAITTPGYQKLINNTLGNPDRAKRFIATITSAVATNPVLQECDAGTILAGALLGESLNLSPSPQLGQFYLVPFNQKEKKDKQGNIIVPEKKNAQFILGYKGYIQLAIRSGQYTKLNVMEIKEGELIAFDSLNEVIDCNLIEDWDAREKANTIGYYAMFEYVNGFRKAIYWSHDKMMSHADKYSPAFSAKKYSDLIEGRIPGLTLQMIQENAYISDRDLFAKAKSMSSFWYKNFDDMAKKTMLRQIISRWGVMSTEMITAIERDSSMIEIDDKNDFVSVPEDKLDILTPEAGEIVEQVDLDSI